MIQDTPGFDWPNDHRYAIVLVDPPWKYHAYSVTGESRSPQAHYKTMTLTEIKALPVAALAAKDCHLFLWTTGPWLNKAFDVIASWGFRYSSTAFVWVKLRRRTGELFFDHHSFHVGMGHTTRKNVEFCLLGRRGNPKRLSKKVRELIISPVREHSRKPDIVHERIEEYCEGPRVEIFGRQRRPGWDVFGDELDKFSAAAE